MIDPARLRCTFLASFALLAAVSAPLSAQPAAAPPPEASTPADPTLLPASFRCFIPIRRTSEGIYEKGLRAVAAADRLRAWHEHLASEPHPSGSPGDLAVIDYIAENFKGFGLDVETQWIWPYLSKPIAAELEIVAPAKLTLPVTEPPIDADPYSKHPALTVGFNAYSGSGDVTAEVVYANYGSKADFEKLASLGIDVKGKIVLARYGGNFRGYKAKYAQAAGAAGLIIYTDPADSGYMKGLMYPEGGWATDRQIQRGNVTTPPQPGDPLTPGVPATEDAPRIDPSKAELPTIPVQPVGWAGAKEIMSRMTGAGVPDDWQGAMPFAYRLTGGADLKVRLMVKQERALTKTANVVGRLTGSRFPDEYIIVGCHHDAWAFGAADPLAGTMLVMEVARCFAKAAAQNARPERTILFCAWAAEEHGIIGSVEWVEAHQKELANAVAYINLDMASMGPLFGASGDPLLRRLIIDATRDVPPCRGSGAGEGVSSVYQEWIARAPRPGSTTEPRMGSMGGGSDHVGFAFHAGVPAISCSGSGSRGTSYHSNYDNLFWYRKVVGDDYEPALMVTRALNVIVARLARADLIPYSPSAIAPDLSAHLDNLEKLAKDRKFELDLKPLREATAALDAAATAFETRTLAALDSGAIGPDSAAALNRSTMIPLARAWMDEKGLPDRPWFKNLYVAPDEDSGYSSWPLPAIRWALERGKPEAGAEAVAAFKARIDRLRETLIASTPK